MRCACVCRVCACVLCAVVAVLWRHHKREIRTYIMIIYKSCLSGMINVGIDQWDKEYPNKTIITTDINSESEN